jgi:hypothetical protein
MSSMVVAIIFSIGLSDEPSWPLSIESGDQPPALSAAIAVIQIDLEDVPFGISNHIVATVSPRVPFTTARWKSAVSSINALMQYLDYIMDFSVPGETQGLRRRFGLFHLDLFSKEFLHRGVHH